MYLAACFAVVARAQQGDLDVRIFDGDGVTFEQIDFTFPNAPLANSDWMLITADPARLFAATGIRRGYINIDCGAGWIVRNLLMDLSDRRKISTFSRAGIDGPVDVRLFNAIVRLSRRPVLSFRHPERNVFPVTPFSFNARGAGDGEPTTPPTRHIAEQDFQAEGETFSIMLPNISNVQAANSQCFPASIANSLQYLEDRYGIVVPNDNKPGLKGDDSLTGKLDEKSGRQVTSRASGSGIKPQPMLAGKGLYLQEAGLADSLVHRHQGNLSGGDINVPGLSSTDDGEQLTFEWLCAQIAAENDVELIFTYEDDTGATTGGHAVRVVGCGKEKGVPWIKYAHDASQADQPGGDETGTIVQQSYLVDRDGDGRLNLGANNIELSYAISEGVTDAIKRGPQAPPQISAAGVTNAASFGSAALSPGAITTLFFQGEIRGEGELRVEAAEQNAALPTELAGASVTIDGEPAPLFFAGSGQINFQIPEEIEPGVVSIVMTIDGSSSAVHSINIEPTGPGLFLLPPGLAGPDRAVIQNQDISLNLPDNPAAPGEAIVVYLTGLGELDNPVPTGQPASADPLSRPLAATSATIGGEDAEILFLGLTPDFVGLGQANLRMPDLPAGDHAVEIRIGEATSNTAFVAVGP